MRKNCRKFVDCETVASDRPNALNHRLRDYWEAGVAGCKDIGHSNNQLLFRRHDSIWSLKIRRSKPSRNRFSAYFARVSKFDGKRLHLFFGRLSASQPLALGGVNYAYSTWHTCCISWHTIC